MSKQVTVSGAEQTAARFIVKRNAAKGVATRLSVTKIANAVMRSASWGRQVAPQSGVRDPRAS